MSRWRPKQGTGNAAHDRSSRRHPAAEEALHVDPLTTYRAASRAIRTVGGSAAGWNPRSRWLQEVKGLRCTPRRDALRLTGYAAACRLRSAEPGTRWSQSEDGQIGAGGSGRSNSCPSCAARPSKGRALLLPGSGERWASALDRRSRLVVARGQAAHHGQQLPATRSPAEPTRSLDLAASG